MGITDKELVICFPAAAKTLGTFAGMMAAAGCKHAINLDGGGSTRVMQNVGGKLRQLSSNQENRANSTWLAIYLKKRGENQVSRKKVCIDPGHGGTDSGAVGQNGTKEKDVVLQIGLLVKAALGSCRKADNQFFIRDTHTNAHRLGTVQKILVKPLAVNIQPAIPKQ